MLDKYAKAIAGAILAALTAFQTALLDGTMSQIEWVGVVIAFVAIFGGVWAVPNASSATTTLTSSPGTLQVTTTTEGPIGAATAADTKGPKHLVLGDEDLH